MNGQEGQDLIKEEKASRREKEVFATSSEKESSLEQDFSTSTSNQNDESNVPKKAKPYTKPQDKRNDENDKATATKDREIDKETATIDLHHREVETTTVNNQRVEEVDVQVANLTTEGGDQRVLHEEGGDTTTAIVGMGDNKAPTENILEPAKGVILEDDQIEGRGMTSEVIVTEGMNFVLEIVVEMSDEITMEDLSEAVDVEKEDGSMYRPQVPVVVCSRNNILKIQNLHTRILGLLTTTF